MNTHLIDFTSDADGRIIPALKHLPGFTRKVRAVIQISHGMGEFKERYSYIAERLTDYGFAVYINDHRGHGDNLCPDGKKGFFHDNEGWNLVCGDMLQLLRIAQEDFPDIPFYLLGHSMGSFLSRSIAIDHGKLLDGVLLSGTGSYNPFACKTGKFLAKSICLVKKPSDPHYLLNLLCFGRFSGTFIPSKFSFNWICSDDNIVTEFTSNPDCFFLYPPRFYYDLLYGLEYISMPENIAKIPSELPFYLFSGTEDPVGDFTNGVKKVEKQLIDSGIKDITTVFYKNARHEILNEKIREKVLDDMIAWLDLHMLQLVPR